MEEKISTIYNKTIPTATSKTEMLDRQIEIRKVKKIKKKEKKKSYMQRVGRTET